MIMIIWYDNKNRYRIMSLSVRYGWEWHINIDLLDVHRHQNRMRRLCGYMLYLTYTFCILFSTANWTYDRLSTFLDNTIVFIIQGVTYMFFAYSLLYLDVVYTVYSNAHKYLMILIHINPHWVKKMLTTQ